MRVQPEMNAGRSDQMAVWANLFGRTLLVRHWRRIGTHAHRRLDPHPNPGVAIDALAAQHRRGREDRP